jgi:hypothetical protein
MSSQNILEAFELFSRMLNCDVNIVALAGVSNQLGNKKKALNIRKIPFSMPFSI